MSGEGSATAGAPPAQSQSQNGECFRDLPEIFEAVAGQCVQARNEAIGTAGIHCLPSIPPATFRDLGPPDLVHVIKNAIGSSVNSTATTAAATTAAASAVPAAGSSRKEVRAPAPSQSGRSAATTLFSAPIPAPQPPSPPTSTR